MSSMIFRLSALVILLSALLTLLACEPTAMPTPTAGIGSAATEVVTPPATEAPVAERDGDDDVQGEVRQLFDTWNRALRERDAALFHSVLTRELAGRCGLEELQSWLDQHERFFEELEVRTVFLDVADPSRAFAEIIARQRAERPEENLTYPWPVALENEKWRAGWLVGLTVESCPYIALPSGPEGGQRDFPQIPGLDLERREDILAAVPGTKVAQGRFSSDNFGSSFSSSGNMSAYDKQVNIYAELQTDSAVAELVSLYRDGLSHPSWDIIDEGSSGDFGWFAWTVLDGDGRLWHGRLVVAPLYQGWRHVWLYLYSGDSDDRQ